MQYRAIAHTAERLHIQEMKGGNFDHAMSYEQETTDLDWLTRILAYKVILCQRA